MVAVEVCPEGHSGSFGKDFHPYVAFVVLCSFTTLVSLIFYIFLT